MFLTDTTPHKEHRIQSKNRKRNKMSHKTETAYAGKTQTRYSPVIHCLKRTTGPQGRNKVVGLIQKPRRPKSVITHRKYIRCLYVSDDFEQEKMHENYHSKMNKLRFIILKIFQEFEIILFCLQK